MDNIHEFYSSEPETMDFEEESPAATLPVTPVCSSSAPPHTQSSPLSILGSPLKPKWGQPRVRKVHHHIEKSLSLEEVEEFCCSQKDLHVQRQSAVWGAELDKVEQDKEQVRLVEEEVQVKKRKEEEEVEKQEQKRQDTERLQQALTSLRQEHGFSSLPLMNPLNSKQCLHLFFNVKMHICHNGPCTAMSGHCCDQIAVGMPPRAL
ncbi:hypothetical protein K439DRAFT_1623254 [Ramaria rubella]|nr:hypothetical protein K439DRAFT_1623254 [Ramaria rubella]